MEIYQMATVHPLCDISYMLGKDGKKAESEARARAIYRRLMALKRDPGLSNNDWCKKAGVNTSFFTQLKGNDNKAPSEPSIGNLRLVVEAVGSSIPEFFADEAKGRLVRPLSQQALERAISEALPGLPRATDRRAQYLAATVARILQLPEGLRDEPANDEMPSADDSDEAAPPR